MTTLTSTDHALPLVLQRDGACLREGVARSHGRERNWARTKPRTTTTNTAHHQPHRWVEKVGRSIKGSEAPQVAAQHRPVNREVVEHRCDPEHVHVGRFQRRRPAPSQRNHRTPHRPRPSHTQRELLRAAGREIPLHTPPAAAIPDQRRRLVAQAHQLGIQRGHQLRNSSHHGHLQSRTTGHHARAA